MIYDFAQHLWAAQSAVYKGVLVPLSALGIVTNTLLISVFCWQTYHPTRLILLVMAVANSAFLFWIHRYRNSMQLGARHMFIDYGVYSTIRTFIVQCGTFMTAVHHLWMVYPKHHNTSPFFGKKRILVCLLVIFLWSITQSGVEEVVLSRVPEESIVIKFSFQLLTIAIPPIMQLALVIRMVYILRLRRRRLGINMLFSAARDSSQIVSVAGQVDSAGRGVGKNASCAESNRKKPGFRLPCYKPHRRATDPAKTTAAALLQPGALGGISHGSSTRSVLMPGHMEACLCKVVIVISVLPIFFSTLLTLWTGYYRKVARTESTPTIWDEVSIEFSDIVQAISASYQFWVFLALVPSFRHMLKLTFWHISCAFSTVARKGLESNITPPTQLSRVTTVSTAASDFYSTSSNDSSTTESFVSHEHQTM
ncbi:hypothetical protein V1264_015906 [Littorina saxatilis]|uniref:Uncharacterized protein n=1 Tax=Littorina saxatilis TaxID=31220 RepID=A0AAN9BM22_9CAEN